MQHGINTFLSKTNATATNREIKLPFDFAVSLTSYTNPDKAKTDLE